MSGKKKREEDESQEKESNRIPNDPFSVRWAEKYHETLEKYWNRLPNFVGSFIASVAVFILGSTIRGEAIVVVIVVIVVVVVEVVFFLFDFFKINIFSLFFCV